MFQISLFKVGLVAMLLLILASMVLNIVSIATTVWGDTGDMGLWYPCRGRDRCFNINPPALIATGTALNILSFLLILVAQLALILPKFRDSFALYFVIGAEITTILSLIFNTIGWYFVFYVQYQQMLFGQGWSFWLMTPSFFLSIFAAIVGSAILGCTCVTNKFEHERNQQLKSQHMATSGPGTGVGGRSNAYLPTNYGYYNEANDPQVLRL